MLRTNRQTNRQTDRQTDGLERLTQSAWVMMIKDKFFTYRRLEAAVEVSEVRTLRAELENPSFQHGTLRVIILEYNVFLQSLDGKVRASSLQLCQQHLHKHVGTQ